jgi:hypothetical protein
MIYILFCSVLLWKLIWLEILNTVNIFLLSWWIEDSKSYDLLDNLLHLNQLSLESSGFHRYPFVDVPFEVKVFLIDGDKLKCGQYCYATTAVLFQLMHWIKDNVTLEWGHCGYDGILSIVEIMGDCIALSRWYLKWMCLLNSLHSAKSKHA